MVCVRAWLLGPPQRETHAMVLLTSTAVNANVYLVSRQFKVIEWALPGSLVVFVGLSAMTTRVVLSLIQVGRTPRGSLRIRLQVLGGSPAWAGAIGHALDGAHRRSARRAAVPIMNMRTPTLPWR